MVGYLCAIVAGSFDLLAGWFALQRWAGRIQPRYIIAFAAGVLLAATFFHILPEVDLKSSSLFLALGFMTFYLLEKLMMIHACGEKECDTHEIGPVAVLGMALDNVTDGAGIMVGYRINPLLGVAITLAVVLHEIPQGMTSALIMREAKWGLRRMLLALGLAGLLYPVGAVLAQLIPPGFQQKMLAFIAGDFIYIGAGDLLPEAHRRFNWKVILLVIVGMVSMLVMKWVCPS
ncbi:MAG: ZIP family metal transporter [Candidatus Omnitrophica bacterium]|nr:ZIP family metal transporter [Candidatus Omnitrophota bacterium]